MMNNNRHRFIIISIFMMVSVFLFSCGIPTFCVLDGISIKKSNESFTVSGSAEDLSLIDIGPGLLISYVIGDTKTPLSELTNSSGIIKSFKDLTAKKLYINNDKSILTYSAGDGKNYTLYAFDNKKNESSVQVSSPEYNFSLNPSNTKITSINKKYDIVVNSWTDNKLDISIMNDSKEIRRITADTSGKNGDFAHIYVAFSAEVGKFSNIYWSPLTYICTVSK